MTVRLEGLEHQQPLTFHLKTVMTIQRLIGYALMLWIHLSHREIPTNSKYPTVLRLTDSERVESSARVFDKVKIGSA